MMVKSVHNQRHMKTSPRHIIQVVSPLTPIQKFFLSAAEIFRVGHLISRKIRILKNKKNFTPFVYGSILDAVAGSFPPVAYISKIVFGSLSALKCSEDLILLKKITSQFFRCIKGREYIVIKGGAWNPSEKHGLSPKADHLIKISSVIYVTQLKLAFSLLVLFFKRLALLSLHLTDMYAAYADNHVQEVFIYQRDLWNILTSDQSHLALQLKRTKQINDYVLANFGSSFTTKILLDVVTLPARIQEGLPDVRKKAKKIQVEIVEKMQLVNEELKEKYIRFLEETQLLKKISQAFIPRLEREHMIYAIGGTKDPDAMRFLSEIDRKIEIDRKVEK